MQKNKDNPDIDQESIRGHWQGDHWVLHGYCKSCDGICENIEKRNDITLKTQEYIL